MLSLRAVAEVAVPAAVPVPEVVPVPEAEVPRKFYVRFVKKTLTIAPVFLLLVPKHVWETAFAGQGKKIGKKAIQSVKGVNVQEKLGFHASVIDRTREPA